MPAIVRGAPLFVALCLAGCTAPVFHQPAVSMPAVFKEAVQRAPDGTTWKVAAAGVRASAAQGAWWRAFDDPALDALIADATASNQDVAVAAARVVQARAILGIAEADRAVQVGVDAGGQRARLSPLEALQPRGAPIAPSNTYSARLSASYEVDLFGRVSASVAAGRADAGVTAANYRATLLTLQADVAQTYFRLRSLDAELTTLQEALRLRQEAVRVTQRRFDLGDIGEFDLVRAHTELASARAEAIGLQRSRTGAGNALALLLGKPASQFEAPVHPLEQGASLPVIPAGLPSALLERRPDIAAAQRAMEAANARIGVARSAMFPALNLSAAGGGVGTSVADVFAWSSRSWLLGAALSAPLFDGGRNRSNIARSEAALDEAVAAYRQRVLAAFADVEDNLAGLRILTAQSEQLEQAVTLARRSAVLAQNLYDAGRGSYLELLDAQRNLSVVERTAVQVRGERAMTTVALIRALGGGWDGA
jgi:multidrug efflux system outer membrane protein